jgi:predicted ArsR family transcriptional regulator
MPKRGSYEIKKRILTVVREKPATYAELERKVDTGYHTIKDNCEELVDYGYINVEKIERHPANGKPSFTVKISESGRAFIAKKEK